MHAADGAVLSEGVWRADRLLTTAEITALAVAALSPSSATGSSSASVPDAASAAPPIAALVDSIAARRSKNDCGSSCREWSKVSSSHPLW